MSIVEIFQIKEVVDAAPADAVGTQTITAAAGADAAAVAADAAKLSSVQGAITRIQERLDAIINVATINCPT